MSRTKLIVCDLDGTLVDSMSGFGTVAQDVIHRHYGTPKLEAHALYQRTSGLPFCFQLEKIFPNDARNAVASAEFECIKRETYAARPFFADVLEVFPRFAAAGYRLCVSSNNDEANVIAKMHALPMACDDVLGFRPGFLKGRDHFEYLFAKHGVSAREVVFIGDSLHDARSAAENGVPFVARLGTFTQKDFLDLQLPLLTVTDFFELYDHLEEGALAGDRSRSR